MLHTVDTFYIQYISVTYSIYMLQIQQINVAYIIYLFNLVNDKGHVTW